MPVRIGRDPGHGRWSTFVGAPGPIFTMVSRCMYIDGPTGVRCERRAVERLYHLNVNMDWPRFEVHLGRALCGEHLHEYLVAEALLCPPQKP